MQDSKKGTKRYFRGQVTDGTKKMRIVGFQEDQLKVLESFDVKGSPVKINECEVQRSSYSNDLEIKLTRKSTIAQSPKKFEAVAGPSAPSSPLQTQISEIPVKGHFDLVNLKIKVLEVNPPCTVSTGTLKQDVIITDSTGVIKLALWENEVGKLEISNSYELLQMSIHTYNGEKYLTYPREGGNYAKIDDIGDVAKVTDNHQHT